MQCALAAGPANSVTMHDGEHGAIPGDGCCAASFRRYRKLASMFPPSTVKIAAVVLYAVAR